MAVSPRRSSPSLDVRVVRECSVRLRVDLSAVTMRVNAESNELRFHFAPSSQTTF